MEEKTLTIRQARDSDSELRVHDGDNFYHVDSITINGNDLAADEIHVDIDVDGYAVHGNVCKITIW